MGAGKIRIATINRPGNWYGLVAWMRLWFKLRKVQKLRREAERMIARDCSPANVGIR